MTANLSSEALFAALSRHLVQLVAAEHISLWLRVDATTIARQFCLEDGAPLAPVRHRLNPEADAISQCLLDKYLSCQSSVAIDAHDPLLALPATLKLAGAQSSYLSALHAGARALGLLVIQARKARAFSDREQLIFRTLSAYTAIALDNANAYEALDAVFNWAAQSSLHAAPNGSARAPTVA